MRRRLLERLERLEGTSAGVVIRRSKAERDAAVSDALAAGLVPLMELNPQQQAAVETAYRADAFTPDGRLDPARLLLDDLRAIASIRIPEQGYGS